MRDYSYVLEGGLFAPLPPFVVVPDDGPPWGWRVSDAAGFRVARARTRAGARSAVHALYAQARPLSVKAVDRRLRAGEGARA